MLSTTDLKVLEQTRQKLAQLTSSLSNLNAQIVNSDPLPSWSSLQTQTQILSQTLSSLASHLENNSEVLYGTAAFPLPTFPGQSQEALLNQLLRKKLEPSVEEWEEDGQQTGRAVTDLNDSTGDIGQLHDKQWENLWEWAAIQGNEAARAHAWGASSGDEEDDEDDDEDQSSEAGRKLNEDVEMGDNPQVDDAAKTSDIENRQDLTGPPVRLEELLKFMSRGELPGG